LHGARTWIIILTYSPPVSAFLSLLGDGFGSSSPDEIDAFPTFAASDARRRLLSKKTHQFADLNTPNVKFANAVFIL